MTSLAAMNSTVVGQMLGRPIADIVVLVAKNMILGSSIEAIQQVLGCERAELEEIISGQDYKDVHLILAANYNAESVEVDLSYDEIERKLLNKLNKKVDSITDVDQMVRVGIFVNKAVRRHRGAAQINPGVPESTVNFQLTKRMVQQLTHADGTEETREIAQQMRIGGNRHINPRFDEVERFFGDRVVHAKHGDAPEAPSLDLESLEAALREVRDGK